MLHRRIVSVMVLAVALGSAARGQEQTEPGTSTPASPGGELGDVVVTAPRAEGDGPGIGIPGVIDRLEVDGYLSAAYGYNLADPEVRRGANEYRLSDADHNTFGVPLARLGLGRRVSGLNEFDAGFRVDLGVGRLMQEALRDDGLFTSAGGSAINLPQAYVELQVPTALNALKLRAGRAYSFFGTETLDLGGNLNYSLSPLTTFGPKTLTGLSVGMDLGGGLRYTQWVGNGWDRVDDNNDAKSLGGTLELNLADPNLRLAFNWIAGPERSDSNGDKRFMLELVLDWKVTAAMTLLAVGQYGEEEFDGGRARFGGASVALRQGFLEVEGEGWHRLALAVRGSYFRDADGARTGEVQDLAEVTATLEVRLLRDAALRVEYRRDWSTKDVFLGSSGLFPSEDSQDTIALELSYAF